jgi:uncharacterized membrane protein YccC
MGALLQNTTVRQAVQVALAVGASIGVGSLISGQRWYWAVIAAFIVSLGVGSRWEAAVKGLQRLFGTIAGIVVGIFLASAVSGHTNLIFALVLVCLFFAFYAFQSAYGVMTFCITLMLALLYGLLGEFEPHLLVLRLEETAAGAAIGVLANIFVLPIRQNEAFAQAARDYLDALSRAISAAGRPDKYAAIVDLRKKTQSLRNSIGAARRGWLPLVPMPYRRAVRAAMRCAYLVRELAEAESVPSRPVENLVERIAGIRRRLDGAQEPVPPLERRGLEFSARSDRILAATRIAVARLDRYLALVLQQRRS